jgi:hypothetical protein
MDSEDENQAAIEGFWKAYNDERIDDCMAIYASDARLRHFSQDLDVTGTEAIRVLMDGALTAVPGRRVQVLNLIAADATVIAETRFEGTVAGSDMSLSIDMCYVFEFRDGLVVDLREYG